MQQFLKIVTVLITAQHSQLLNLLKYLATLSAKIKKRKALLT